MIKVANKVNTVRNNRVEIDFKPLYECIHIHEALGQRDELRASYESDRRTQRDLIIPARSGIGSIAELKDVLATFAGFAIIEKVTMQKTFGFRSAQDVRLLTSTLTVG